MTLASAADFMTDVIGCRVFISMDRTFVGRRGESGVRGGKGEGGGTGVCVLILY